MSEMSSDSKGLAALSGALRSLGSSDAPAEWLQHLVQRGLDQLPQPGSGRTLQRWQALAQVAAKDLSLAKLYEGHTDALAIMAELCRDAALPQGTWGIWAAEAPGSRTLIEDAGAGQVRLRGTKFWCSGAAVVDHGLLTAWYADGRGPQLVRVGMRQAGITVDSSHWQAVGMAASSSVDVSFNDVTGALVGAVGDYLTRPGFWQGGAGIAACWYGGAQALADCLRRALMQAPLPWRTSFRLAALGKIDTSLQTTAATLRQTAAWIDAHPADDASAATLRARLAAETCATLVLDEAGRALGASAFCRNAQFARMAADLPVYVRQSHGEKDFATLGGMLMLASSPPWTL
jgi:alkylation response protein AidB-like acyl-CoA dehydrogenase